jgi:hypothetical protein
LHGWDDIGGSAKTAKQIPGSNVRGDVRPCSKAESAQLVRSRIELALVPLPLIPLFNLVKGVALDIAAAPG